MHENRDLILPLRETLEEDERNLKVDYVVSAALCKIDLRWLGCHECHCRLSGRKLARSIDTLDRTRLKVPTRPPFPVGISLLPRSASVARDFGKLVAVQAGGSGGGGNRCPDESYSAGSRNDDREFAEHLALPKRFVEGHRHVRAPTVPIQPWSGRRSVWEDSRLWDSPLPARPPWSGSQRYCDPTRKRCGSRGFTRFSRSFRGLRAEPLGPIRTRPRTKPTGRCDDFRVTPLPENRCNPVQRHATRGNAQRRKHKQLGRCVSVRDQKVAGSNPAAPTQFRKYPEC